MKSNLFYSLFFSSILFNIVIRYPLAGHSNGTDSFEQMWSSNSIVKSGQIIWLRDIFSYMGISAYSIESSLPVFVASVKLLSNSNIESTALIISLFLSSLLFLLIFLLSGIFSSDLYYRIFSSHVSSTTFLALRYGDWSIETRYLFLILSILLVFIILSNNISTYKKINLISIILISILSTHSMVFLWLVFFPAIIFTNYVTSLKLFDHVKRRKLFYYIIGFCSFLVTFFMYLTINSIDKILNVYSSQFFESFPLINDNFILALLKIIIISGENLGLICIFFPLAILYNIGISSRLKKRHFLVLISFVMPIFLLYGIYGLIFSFPIIILFSCFFVFQISKFSIKPFRYFPLFIVVLNIFLASLIFIDTDEETNSNTKPKSLDEETFSASIYIKETVHEDETYFAKHSSDRIFAISEVPFAPQKGHGKHSTNAVLSLEAEDFSLMNLIFSPQTLLVPKSQPMQVSETFIFSSHLYKSTDAQRVVSLYNTNYIVYDKTLSDQDISLLESSAHKGSYKSYENERIQINCLGEIY